MLPGVAFFASDCDSPMVQILMHNLMEQGFPIKAIWCPKVEDCLLMCETKNINFYSTNIDEILLLPSVHLIVICCYPHYHNQIVTKACCIGKHVLCDLPPSNSLPETIKMKNASNNYPLLITMFMSSLRFVPTFKKMKRLLMDGILGNIRLINANIKCDVASIQEEDAVIWDSHMGGGLLSLYGINMIDIITYITGYRAQRVHGMVMKLKNLKKYPSQLNSTEDYAIIQMQLLPPPIVVEYDKNTRTKQPNRPQRLNRDVQMDILLHRSYSDKSKSNSNLTKIDSKSNSMTTSHRKLITDPREESLVSVITISGHYHKIEPKHEIHIVGTKGYIVSRDGDLYICKDGFYDPQLTSPQLSQNGQKNLKNNSHHNSSLSIMDTSSFDLINRYDINYNQETLIYSLDEDYHSSMSSSLSTSLDHHLKYYEYTIPKLYITGIRNMIISLKNAFTTDNNSDNMEIVDGELNNNKRFNHQQLSPKTDNNIELKKLLSGSVDLLDHTLDYIDDAPSNGKTPSVIVDSKKSKKENLLQLPNTSKIIRQSSTESVIHWNKHPVEHAATFSDAVYLHEVLKAVRISSDNKEWVTIHSYQNS